MLIRICAFVSLTSLSLSAQTGVEWIEYAENGAKLAVDPTSISTSSTEVDFAVGDLDKNGWLDAVLVRGPGASSLGVRSNILLMNRDGVLFDETALFASSSDLPLDQGFSTETGDRDVTLSDLDGDGWLDVVTAPSLMDGSPKAISHPRVYMNRGEDGSGNWLGLRHEDARIPQLLTTGGLAVAPRFCDVAAGDVDGDGFPDLHFVDYDSTQTGISEPAGHDLNDRLLINDGTAHFVDESSLRLTTTQLASNFGLANKIVDVNGNGRLDILKLSSLGAPYDVQVLYNDAMTPGMFQLLGTQGIGSNAPYGFDAGDLNSDGRIDAAFQDDGLDRYRLNEGTDVLGRAIWGPLKVFEHAGGNDPGFGHKVRIADLDADGWNEVLICDYDIEFPGCNRRLHIYHNLADGADVTLREEAEFDNGDQGPGWKGVVGMTAADMRGTMDVAVADFDEDGDNDMLVANCAGTSFWENRTVVDDVACATSLGHAGPGALVLSLCGGDLSVAGESALLEVVDAPASAPLWIGIGGSQNPTPLFGGTLVPTPDIVLALATDSEGGLAFPIGGVDGLSITLYAQALSLDGGSFVLSNAIEVIVP